MDAESVNAVIDNIVDKLGIVANGVNDLVPEFTRLEMSSHIVFIIFEVIALITSSLILRNIWCKFESDDGELEHEVMWYAVFIITCILMIYFVFAFIFDVRDLVGWIVSPNAKAIEYVFSLIGNT